MNAAYDNGLITNRLYGEETVEGEKLWKNISSILEEADYPIAYVTLLRDNNAIEIEKKFEKDHESNPTLSALNDALELEGVSPPEIATLITRQQKIDKLIEIEVGKMLEAKGLTQE